jgi:hypothetical protein
LGTFEWLKFDHIFISPYELQFLFVFQFLCPKSIFFESFRSGIIPLDFLGFLFRISKFKNDINYIKFKFSHRFGKICKWLNMYYSNIRIVAFKKLTTMFIWFILKILYELVGNVIFATHHSLHLFICHIWAQIWYSIKTIMWKM